MSGSSLPEKSQFRVLLRRHPDTKQETARKGSFHVRTARARTCGTRTARKFVFLPLLPLPLLFLAQRVASPLLPGHVLRRVQGHVITTSTVEFQHAPLVLLLPQLLGQLPPSSPSPPPLPPPDVGSGRCDRPRCPLLETRGTSQRPARRRAAGGRRQRHCDADLFVFPRSPPPLCSGGPIAFNLHQPLKFSMGTHTAKALWRKTARWLWRWWWLWLWWEEGQGGHGRRGKDKYTGTLAKEARNKPSLPLTTIQKPNHHSGNLTLLNTSHWGGAEEPTTGEEGGGRWERRGERTLVSVQARCCVQWIKDN